MSETPKQRRPKQESLRLQHFGHWAWKLVPDFDVRASGKIASSVAQFRGGALIDKPDDWHCVDQCRADRCQRWKWAGWLHPFMRNSKPKRITPVEHSSAAANPVVGENLIGSLQPVVSSTARCLLDTAMKICDAQIVGPKSAERLAKNGSARSSARKASARNPKPTQRRKGTAMKSHTILLLPLILLSAIPARPDIVIQAKDGRTFRVPLDGKDVESIEFDSPQSAPDSKQPGSLEGDWISNHNIAYKISQNGSSFSWWAETIHEKANGTISGNNLSASWQGDWGKNSGSARIAAFDLNGRPTRVEWANGTVFTRK
jgi:hypothetical protein